MRHVRSGLRGCHEPSASHFVMQTSDVEVDLTADLEEATPPKRQKVAASKSPAASAKVKAEPKTKPKAEPKAEPKTEPKAKPKGKGTAAGDKRKRGRKSIDAKSDGEEDDDSFEVGTAHLQMPLG